MTFDVKLPMQQAPRYPNRCVACARANPDTNANVVVMVSVRSQSISSELVGSLVFGSSNGSHNRHIKLNPPACSSCCSSINRTGLLAVVCQYVFPLLGVAAFFLGLVYGYSTLGIAGLIAGVLWPAIWSVVRPPALSVTAYGDELVYEFRSATVGNEFRELNVTSAEEH